MSLGGDKGHDRKRIFQPRSRGASVRGLASRPKIRVESCFTIDSVREFVDLRGRGEWVNFSIDVAVQPDESDSKGMTELPNRRTP